MAKKRGLEKVYVHCFLDGRDVPPRSAVEYVTKLNPNIKIIPISARTGEGIDEWANWLRDQVAAWNK